MRRAHFTYTIEVEQTDDNGDTWEEWVDVQLSVPYEIEPGQNGGMTDPSWSAYGIIAGSITDDDGRVYESDGAIAAAEAAIDEAVNDRRSDW